MTTRGVRGPLKPREKHGPQANLRFDSTEDSRGHKQILTRGTYGLMHDIGGEQRGSLPVTLKLRLAPRTLSGKEPVCLYAFLDYTMLVSYNSVSEVRVMVHTIHP